LPLSSANLISPSILASDHAPGIGSTASHFNSTSGVRTAQSCRTAARRAGSAWSCVKRTAEPK
jgi:hypothetical protein